MDRRDWARFLVRLQQKSGGLPQKDCRAAKVAVLALRALRPRRAGGLDVQAAARLQRTPCAALRGATPRSARSSTSGGSSARAASTAPAQSGPPGRPSRRPPPAQPLRRSTRRYSSQLEEFYLWW